MPDSYQGSAADIAQLRQNIERANIVGSLVARDFKSSMLIVPLLDHDSATGRGIDYYAFSQKLEQLRNQYEAIGAENGGGGAAAPAETYHIVHLPLTYSDGAPTGKEAWPEDALDALARARLIAAGETVWEGQNETGPRTELAELVHQLLTGSRTITGPDRRARFDGGVWPSFDAARLVTQGSENPAISAGFDFAMFFGDFSGENATFSGVAWFHSATFSGAAGFNGATFSGLARFDSATFSDDARFDSATFSGDARFTSATFSDDARFDSATFCGVARFDSATFSGGARFFSTTFSGDAGFDRATFSGAARFTSATFSGDAGFDRATFGDDAWFASATFSGDAGFDRATFGDDAWFASATFSGDARFDSATFSGVAWFFSATFSGEARFTSAAFVGPVHFAHARFRQRASFLGQGALLKALDRRAAWTLPKDGDGAGAIHQVGEVTDRARRAFLRADFEAAVFEGDADFSNRDFLEPSSFRNVVFLGLAEFHGSDLHQGQSFHGAAFEAVVKQAWPQERQVEHLYALDRALAELPRLFKQKPRKVEAFAKWFEAAQKAGRGEGNNDHYLFARPLSGNARYEQIENAFRTLKLAMEENRNRTEEQSFYKLELQARRKRTDVPGWERWVSDRYAGWSDYGNSLARPFNRLLIAIGLFAMAYWGWGLALPLPKDASAAPDFFDALSFSFGRVAPFGPWADDAAWRKFMDAQGSMVGFAARFLATIQSGIAVILAFLFALAVRRRFQIN
jgi:hypothetical protein